MKKRFLPLTLTLVMALTLLPTAALAAEITVTEIVPCKYDDVGNFSEGLAWVKDEKGMWGFVDTSGKEVIPLKYRAAGDFSSGLAPVRDATTGLYGFIGKTGEVVIPFRYSKAAAFTDGFAGVSIGGKCSYIDTTGKEVIPCDKYDNVYGFSEGVAKVSIKETYMTSRYGYIDTAGKEIAPCIYNEAEDFAEGLAYVGTRDEKGDLIWGFIDKTGKEVIHGQYRSADSFSEGLARVVDENGMCGFIDTTGKEVIPCMYPFRDISSHFSEGLVAVGRSGEAGFIDPTGKEVIPRQYYSTYDFSDGLAAVMGENFKWGYIDAAGNEVIPCQLDYAFAHKFSDGLASVMAKDGVHNGYIDVTGKEVVPCKYRIANDFSGGFARVKDTNGKYGFLAISTNSAPPTNTAYASIQTVMVDGTPVVFNAYALKDENGNDTNYVKLRDVAQILNGSAAQFEVGYDGSITITTGQAYTPNGSELIQNFTGNQSYTVNISPIKVNGVETGLEAITLTDTSGGGFNYFKLRDLGTALGFKVDWSAERGIFIETK